MKQDPRLRRGQILREEGWMENTEWRALFATIDDWYSRAPEGMSENDAVRWVQHTAEIPCPQCGAPLWVMRTRRAQNRGFYHLAMCQASDCDFQIDD